MNVLITGGTGFVGRHLAEELSRDHHVTLLVRNPSRLENFPGRERITIVAGDLTGGAPLPGDVEMVFHLAAVTKARRPGDFHAVNVSGTEVFLERLRSLPRLRRVLLLSSQAAAGPSVGDRPRDEEDIPAPVSSYGRSKLAQENIVSRLAPVPWVIVRAPTVFGPHDMDMLQALRTVRSGWLLQLGHVQRYYSIIYVRDLVAAMSCAAFSSPDNELFYAANDVPIEMGGWLALAAQLLGQKRLRPLTVPVPVAFMAAALAEGWDRLSGRAGIFNRDKIREMRHPSWLCTNEKMRQTLHFQPQYGLTDALQTTIDWYRQRGLL